jgi:hypothetical protein
MRFARNVFLIAGIYGLVILIPGYFLERTANEMAPPAITHPEFYYGFYGAALAWQLVFLAIARDPAGLRPLMLLGAVEKLTFFAACLALYFTNRLAFGGPLMGSLVDGVWLVLFIVAWRRVGPATI